MASTVVTSVAAPSSVLLLRPLLGGRSRAAGLRPQAEARLQAKAKAKLLGSRQSCNSRHVATTATARGSGSAAVADKEADADRELKEGIAGFYDASSGVWEDMWGEHMHHGYYEGGVRGPATNDRQAQIEMIERALAFARIDDGPQPRSILDAGCGIGGSARYLARRFESCERAVGITLSPVQAARARAITAKGGLADRPFEDASFDFVYSMESGEHMPDKRKDIRTTDWSKEVSPFWPAVIKSALTPQGFIGLLRSGWTTIRGALVMALMVQGYQRGLIKFAVITARKPQ
eukprot:jgi/Chlat1/7184/Chrsp57S06845